MQLVLCKNRVVAHGENFLSMGGTVINTVTGAKHENATIAECNGCPSDIDEVGYEYHAGVFVPCAPYGKGNNNGYFMEVCESCATPRNSGIPIKKGIKLENLNEEVDAEALGAFDDVLLWENADTTAEFPAQTISFDPTEYKRFKIIIKAYTGAGFYSTHEVTLKNTSFILSSGIYDYSFGKIYERTCNVGDTGIFFYNAKEQGVDGTKNYYCIPYRIIGYKHL